MKNYINFTLIIGLISLIVSCDRNERDLFNIDIIQKNGEKTITYIPILNFENAVDSAQYLFDDKDYQRVLTSDIKVAPPIYQDDKIKVRIFLRAVYKVQSSEYGFLVRTFSKDGKIKDEMVLASTIGNLNCIGKVTNDLKILTNCPDGNEVVAQIEQDGTIKTLENE